MKNISDNLYFYEDTCNVYIIKKDNSAILIDFGSGKVMDKLPSLGISHVEAILVTHHHRDQIQGLSFAVNYGIPIFVPHTEQDLISSADQMWQRREISNNYNNRQDRFSLLESVTINGTLKDYSSLTLLGYNLFILPTPGHTTGSISLISEIDGKQCAFTGDLIYEAGKVWSLAATQWTYNGGEGIPFSILSLLSLSDRNVEQLFPSHGFPMDASTAIPITVENLTKLLRFRRHNPRLFELRETPYQNITENLLFNRTSMSNSYVLISESRKALIIDLGYDFMAGVAAGSDRSSRRPWLYTFPTLMKDYSIDTIDACIPTHYHDDHIAAFNLLRDTYGTKVMCSETFADILENPSSYDIPCLWYDSIPVDVRLPVNETIKWEEYELKLYPLSGHTKYNVAIEFIVDGKKILCGSDQYADDDGLMCNYVYKNIFEYSDYCDSAKLYAKINPDIILTGHWMKFNIYSDYLIDIEKRGKELEELHYELLPTNIYKSVSSDFCAKFSPYYLTTSPDETITIKLKVKNPLMHEGVLTSELILPEGFRSDNPILTADMQPQETVTLTYQVTVPSVSINKYRIRMGCNIMINNYNIGQQAEMLITIIDK